jgi:hypothetical protein
MKLTDPKDYRVLRLTLSALPFEVMRTGEKLVEYRKPSDWIKSRLVGKSYDVVHFTNGYGKDKPFFIAQYRGYEIEQRGFSSPTYSNGLKVEVAIGDFKIYLGSVLQKGNLKSTEPAALHSECKKETFASSAS